MFCPLLCIKSVGLQFKETDRTDQKTKNIGQHTVSYSQEDIAEFGRTVIRQYKQAHTRQVNYPEHSFLRSAVANGQ